MEDNSKRISDNASESVKEAAIGVAKVGSIALRMAACAVMKSNSTLAAAKSRDTWESAKKNFKNASRIWKDGK